MYKLLIVDDEKIERESMENLIPWKNHNINVVGSAWNGVEGCEKIEKYVPDIVLTDIKMPIMNGIEMIAQIQKRYPDIVFVILSGYGEYEYTSQAMELGIKHYILKPCDETKILPVMSRVKNEIEENKKLLYESKSIEKILPNAKEQFLKKILEGETISKSEYDFYLESCGGKDRNLRLLGLRIENNSDTLDKFVINNILDELIEEGRIILDTNIGNEIWILSSIETEEEIEMIIMQAKNAYKKYDNKKIDAAVSEIGSFDRIHDMYDQVKLMLNIGVYLIEDEVISREKLAGENDKVKLLTELQNINDCKTYEELYFKIIIIHSKFQICKYTDDEKQLLISSILQRITEDANISIGKNELENKELFLDKLEKVLSSHISFEQDNMSERMRTILKAVYLNLDNEKLSLQWISNEILFMNNDYLSRYFKKNTGKKFSSYVISIRMRLVDRILNYNLDIPVSKLTELVGFSQDGQYFSKVFKKYYSITFTEYKEELSKR